VVREKDGAVPRSPAIVSAEPLELQTPSAPLPAGAAVAADGRYRISVPPGRWRVAASHLGPPSDRRWARPFQTTVSAGKTIHADLDLPDTGSFVRFEGRVVEPDGKPAARALVKLLHPNDASVICDDEGRFTLVAPIDGPIAFAALKGGRRGRLSLFRPDAALEIRLVASAKIRVRLVDPAGVALGRFEVRWRAQDYRLRAQVTKEDFDGLGLGGLSGRGHDTRDRFSITELIPDRYAIEVTTDDGRWACLKTEVKAGDALEVELPLSAPGGKGESCE
jgi:hypothetical protein